MDIAGLAQIALALAVVALATRPLGRYLHIIFEREQRPVLVAAIERVAFALIGTSGRDQTWRGYAGAALGFAAAGIALVFVLLQIQGLLPYNPAGVEGWDAFRSFNAAVSFVTNTNWQSFPGAEVTSPLIQLVAFTWQNFVSAATGLAVAVAIARGLARRQPAGGLGNFWVDLTRATLFVLLPLAFGLAIVFAALGVPQTLESAATVTTLDGEGQQIALGLVASQEAIKQLGTNGGGFFNANTAHPFEGPSALAIWLSAVAMLLVPAAATNLYGRICRDPRQGWSLFGAMMVLLIGATLAALAAETGLTAALAGLPLAGDAPLEGKDVRVGVALSVFYGVITTATSSGAVAAMHDSVQPLTGLVLLFNMLLGEVVFGGVGVGLYGMLAMVVLTVFIAGLMVGRTPELLGKKVEAREVILVVATLLAPAFMILAGVAASLSLEGPAAAVQDAGPHGISEMLYAYTSAAMNNGSAFAGISADTPWHNTLTGIAMLVGRFVPMVAILALAGSMAEKRVTPPGPGTFASHGVLFAGLLIGVIVLVGALTYFPVLALGPLLEHASAAVGRLF
jgi:K+-transporting ATPase ATPase A chain